MLVALQLRDLIPSTGFTINRTGIVLNNMPNFADTTAIHGPAKQGRIGAFIKLYPNYFRTEGIGAKMMVFRALPPEPKPAQPRPVQIGGSSSSGAEPADRMPRAAELESRAAYRRFPNEQRVEYLENPARLGTPRYRRFERYKAVNTIGEARRLGATSQDISMDLSASALKLL